jgi:hypothetical protein
MTLGRATSRRAIAVSLLAAIVLAASASHAAVLTTEALLDTLQHTAFNYFWNEANPSNGMVKDRSTSTSPCSVAAMGFGLSAICIGIDHGWVTRDTGRDRVLTTLQTLWTQPQGPDLNGKIGYKGLYYHFLDMNTATRTWNSELSTIDTALLFGGVLDAKQYFSSQDASDTQVRALADSIYYRADWEFMRNVAPTNTTSGILMGWKPGTQFNGFGPWIGYNEAMILYILALGSPTHPVPAGTWGTWTGGYSFLTSYNLSFVHFAPLFGHQYSHCWIDYRFIWDSYMQSHGITYFENSRRATLANRQHAIRNQFGWVGYGANLWGLTASDGPGGYNARGAPPAQNDDGTITPTAAASSIAFAANEVIPTLQNMFDSYGAHLWGPYGFKDAFNLTVNWWDTDYLGIDQGPIVIMIENYLNGRTWRRFTANEDIQRGLQRAGFTPATGAGVPAASGVRPFVLLQSSPNPFRGVASIPFHLAEPGRVSLALYDVSGRRVKTLVDGVRASGDYQTSLNAQELSAGVYFYRMEFNGQRAWGKCVLLR